MMKYILNTLYPLP